MTDRDTFAAAALTGLIVSMTDEYELDEVCQSAYGWADAMLKARGTAVRGNCVSGNQPEMPCPVTEPMPKEKRAEVSCALTDAEREAVRFFSLIDGPHNVPVANKRAATLRGLLERLGGER